ncbi:hypothetical protein P692DRAFT_20872454 [Suillus brevipes Sb2]|nr:hypothetical protein P692DRAFT_20872454 [Suillus brevipes Sb2]
MEPSLGETCVFDISGDKGIHIHTCFYAVDVLLNESSTLIVEQEILADTSISTDFDRWIHSCISGNAFDHYNTSKASAATLSTTDTSAVYVSRLAANLVNTKIFDVPEWDTLASYLAFIAPTPGPVSIAREWDVRSASKDTENDTVHDNEEEEELEFQSLLPPHGSTCRCATSATSSLQSASTHQSPPAQSQRPMMIEERGGRKRKKTLETGREVSRLVTDATYDALTPTLSTPTHPKHESPLTHFLCSTLLKSLSTVFVPLHRMSLNPNGKIDKPTLPFPDTWRTLVFVFVVRWATWPWYWLSTSHFDIYHFKPTTGNSPGSQRGENLMYS